MKISDLKNLPQIQNPKPDMLTILVMPLKNNTIAFLPGLYRIKSVKPDKLVLKRIKSSDMPNRDHRG